MAMNVQTARKRTERPDSLGLEDTGVAVTFRLNTDPVTLREAEALLVFMRRCVDASVAAYQDQYSYVELVPVIVVRKGSLETVLRFFHKKNAKKKKKKGKGEGVSKEILIEAAKGGATEFAKQVAIILVGALALWSGIKTPPPLTEPPTPPAMVRVVANEARPALSDLRNEFDKSGKPWTLRVEHPEGRTITLEPRRPPPRDGNFDL